MLLSAMLFHLNTWHQFNDQRFDEHWLYLFLQLGPCIFKVWWKKNQ
jgi:hypothetical protein